MSTISNTFRTGEPGLTELLNQVHAGDLQLPDFQRGWVWDDDHIRSLIASISRSYPIGSVMLLEAGGDGARFKPRAVQGAPEHNGKKPGMLILDGQQRMTSLYLALRSGQPVPTTTEKGKDIDRVYYLDIAMCLDPEADREDAVVSLGPNRMRLVDFNRTVELDVSSAEREYELGYFPLATLFSDGYYDWCQGYRAHHGYDKQKLTLLDAFEREVIQRFRAYRVPTIELTRETGKEAVCQVFEKVNTGGVALTVFELMTATFAADEFDLRQDWKGRSARLQEKEVLQSVEATDFLQAVTLLASYKRHRAEGTGVSCKRKDILNLSLAQYRQNADLIERGLFEAARLLVREKVFDSANLPYRTQIVPLAAACAVLGDRFESDAVKQKLARWYWCGVFGELYGGTTETRFANDIVDVVAWIEGGADPRTVRDANLAPTRLLTLQTRQSAAYKGMMALLMQTGSNDFINGDSIELTTFFDQAVEIHHVFPRAHCEKQGYPRQRWNSVINKAPITARTNRLIGGNAPSRYLATIEKSHGVAPERLDEIVATHRIAPSLLRADDFDAFIRDRACQLLDLVEKAIGKAVAGRDSEEVVEQFGGPLTAGNGTITGAQDAAT
ncbi:MAG: DUF262 domain-containing protein [Deltaproteobacteria bacterium]|nr:DUF262 domain-containing protein [Deltaproteobacteria bacterium]